MEKAIETIELEGGITIEIFRDEDASGPDEHGDNNAFLVHYHRDCWIENKDVLSEDDLRDIYQGNKTETTAELKRKYHIFPVAAYIHSGVALSLGSSFLCDSQGWDTSHVGAIFLAKEEWKRKDKKALKYAEGMIEEWNQFLSGDVYGYVVKDADGETLDSCWGFYGFDYAVEEAKSMADYHVKEFKKKKQEKLKALIKNRVPLEKRAEVLS